MNHIKSLTDGFTNQRVFNIEFTNKIYKALQDKHLVDSSWITLRPMFYKDQNEDISEAT